ncbi:MAG: hypothetical protein Q8R44_11320 [Novosphingobium sp.]|nr:hypothetical protein [Novosphingobium sp.]
MRTLVLTMLVILGVVFGGTHASAFQHIDEATSAFVQAGEHPHSHADDDHDDDGGPGSDQMGSEVGTHNHCAMDRAVGSAGVACLVRVASEATLPPATRALSSLDQAPPLEPPSA